MEDSLKVRQWATAEVECYLSQLNKIRQKALKWSAYAQHGAGTADLHPSRRILLHVGRRPSALRTPPASLCISTLPRPPPAALGTVLLHSAHIIHACPRYKALADYPSSRRSPTLRSPRRLYKPSGLPTAWQTGPAQHVACPTRHIFLRHSP